MKHTPGPWKTVKSYYGRKYRCVQIGKDDLDTSELKPADAKLIAASPELLEALLEDIAVRKELVRMRKEYPAGTANSDDAWFEFGDREHALTILKQKAVEKATGK